MGLVALQPNQVVRVTDRVDANTAPAMAQMNPAVGAMPGATR
jgi:hypothetical protein